MKEQYIEKRFGKKYLQLIEIANTIIDEYQEQGFELTLRQLYYQFVARGILPNNMKMYKMLANVINDGRLAGLVDWDAIVDRTRSLRGRSFWASPAEICRAAVSSFFVDPWIGQDRRPEVWVEKDALLGVFEPSCVPLGTSYFSCRGYTSQSEMWAAAKRIMRRYDATGQETVIYHFGDHDPSGLDMSRDIEERLEMFCEGAPAFEFKRVALGMGQVHQYKCPPNPAKTTDSRASEYIHKYGKESWELDALDPKVLGGLLKTNILSEINDQDAWDAQAALQAEGRKKLQVAADDMELS